MNRRRFLGASVALWAMKIPGARAAPTAAAALGKPAPAFSVIDGRAVVPARSASPRQTDVSGSLQRLSLCGGAVRQWTNAGATEVVDGEGHRLADDSLEREGAR